MKKYMMLHYGFEPPTPEIMAAWERWFESIGDRMVEKGGFSAGKEISDAGSRDLPWSADSMTGYNIVSAESLEEAEELARANPYVKSIRVYEICLK